MRRLKGHLTYANVVASIALFVALGGVSYAAVTLPSNSVGTAQLKRSAVTLSKISPAARDALHGEAGAQGQMGPAGPKGETGAQGIPGTAVAQGATGAMGATGAAGATGATGAKGATGSTGGKGETGDRGPSDGYAWQSVDTESASTGNVTVSSHDLGAGDYIVTVHLNVVGQYGAPMQCQLVNGSSSVIDGARMRIDPKYMETGNEMSFTGPVSNAGTTTLSVRCAFPDVNDTGHQYTFNVSATAVKVATLHVG